MSSIPSLRSGPTEDIETGTLGGRIVDKHEPNEGRTEMPDQIFLEFIKGNTLCVDHQ